MHINSWYNREVPEPFSMKSKPKITRLVVTGGPGGGKTESLPFIKRELEERGVIALVMPEAATLCINGGIHPMFDHVGVKRGQRAIMHLCKQMQRIWMMTAESLVTDKPVVVLFDRGLADSIAYVPDEDMYHELLNELGTNHSQVCSAEHGVVHMKTAALGTQGYTRENNDARYEDAAAACATDLKIRNAWLGTSRLLVIEPEELFATKKLKALQAILSFIGMPVPIEKEKKFLVRVRGEIPVPTQSSEIEQFYCMCSDPEGELRMRTRTFDGHSEYWQTIKSPNPDGEGRREEETSITRDTYLLAKESFRNPKLGIVRKTRTCFLIAEKYYAEMDKFESIVLNDDPTIRMLEIEYTEDAPEFEFPDWLERVADVTEDPEYKNKNLAKQALKREMLSASS